MDGWMEKEERERESEREHFFFPSEREQHTRKFWPPETEKEALFFSQCKAI